MTYGSRRTNHESGLTLVELLVVTAIMAIVVGVLALIMYQLVNIPRWGTAQLAVDSDLRNAGIWLMRDGNESTVFTSTGTCGVFAAPTYAGTTRYVTYTFSAAEGRLSRQDSDTGQTTGVARHVTGVQCPLGAVTDTMVISITATSGEGKNQVSATQVYTVTLRVQ